MAKRRSTKTKVAITKSGANQDVKDNVGMKRNKSEHEKSEACDDITEAKRRKAANRDATDIISDITKKESAEEPSSSEGEEGGEGGENLSPEEKRVLERKLKKIRRKEEKKKQREEGKKEPDRSGTSAAQTQALEYLTCWSEKREEWKFQKTRQVWLLQHMYDSEKVSDAHFKVLLSYLEGLKGVARDTTVQKAETLVRLGEGSEEAMGGATDSQKAAHRAREVVQILS